MHILTTILSHTRTHARTHARTHVRTHTHTRTHTFTHVPIINMRLRFQVTSKILILVVQTGNRIHIPNTTCMMLLPLSFTDVPLSIVVSYMITSCGDSYIVIFADFLALDQTANPNIAPTTDIYYGWTTTVNLLSVRE